jgi:hypothetical protein
MDEHSRNWCLARIPILAPYIKVTFEKPIIEQIYEKLEELAKMQKKGLFRLDRQKDMLTTAIGTPKHSGCVRGMSSTLPWGKAFC